MSIISDLIGGGIKGIAESASSIIKDFKADPNKVLETEEKLKELANKAQEITNSLTISLEQEYSKQLETVNQTMREEAKSDHFLVYSWRPIVAYTFCAVIVNNYILFPYLHAYEIVMLDIPTTIWITMGSILGVTAVGRTLEKIQALK